MVHAPQHAVYMVRVKPMSVGNLARDSGIPLEELQDTVRANVSIEALEGLSQRKNNVISEVIQGFSSS